MIKIINYIKDIIKPESKTEIVEFITVSILIVVLIVTSYITFIMLKGF